MYTPPACAHVCLHTFHDDAHVACDRLVVKHDIPVQGDAHRVNAVPPENVGCVCLPVEWLMSLGVSCVGAGASDTVMEGARLAAIRLAMVGSDMMTGMVVCVLVFCFGVPPFARLASRLYASIQGPMVS